MYCCCFMCFLLLFLFVFVFFATLLKYKNHSLFKRLCKTSRGPDWASRLHFSNPHCRQRMVFGKERGHLWHEQYKIINGSEEEP